jgi:hypothetical protein
MGFTIDLSMLMERPQGLQLGLAMVIENKSGDISYWALDHCGERADFHQRLNWQISL